MPGSKNSQGNVHFSKSGKIQGINGEMGRLHKVYLENNNNNNNNS